MRRLNHKSGFSLVEVALALAIAVFCLVVMLALLPVGLSTGRTTTAETIANGILNQVVSDLRATTPTSPPGAAGTSSQQFNITVPASGSASANPPPTLYFTAQGVSSTTLTANTPYKLTVTFPATTGGRTASIAIAKVTWPAASANPTGMVESFVALDRN
jgi:uncharacterized protein (TIGR02598 family)